jgi:anti-sigma B factor antagonist
MRASVLEIGDELTAQSMHGLKKQVRCLVASGHLRPIVDLSQVSVIDYGGLAALLAALRIVREAGGSLSLIGGNCTVDTLLALSALDRVFKVYLSRQAALSNSGLLAA